MLVTLLCLLEHTLMLFFKIYTVFQKHVSTFLMTS